MKNRDPFTLTLTLISAILTTITPTVLAQPQPPATEIYIDKNCRRNQQLPQLERYTIFFRNEFTTNGQKYWFYSARYQDGGVVLCISKPNFDQPKPVNQPKIQANFIDKIVRDTKNKTAFIITVREGNGLDTTHDKLWLRFQKCRSTKTHLPFPPTAAGNPQRRRPQPSQRQLVPRTQLPRTCRSIRDHRPHKQVIQTILLH